MKLRTSILPVIACMVASLALQARPSGQANDKAATGGAMGLRNIDFNANWQLHYPQSARLYSGQVRTVTLPRAWNEDEAFRVGIAQLPTDTCRYTKNFHVPSEWRGKHVFIEFEGVRQAAKVWLNGNYVGMHQNGVMAFGFELTPYLLYNKVNHLEVLTDNDWDYKEKGVEEPANTHTTTDGNNLPNNTLAPTAFQWNNKNFNMNMGGVPKRVKLHVVGEVYQTLPLYSDLGTTGTYVYGSHYDIKRRKVRAHVESQVVNASARTRNVALRVDVIDLDGKRIARFGGKAANMAAGDTLTLRADHTLSGVHFWSWGYGYLYKVLTTLLVDGKPTDTNELRTGFRKTDFRDGKVMLNDRCLLVHGYAQRTNNEWPGLGIDVPEWLSDYSNRLMVQSGGNVVRWMHVTPSKQDVESCDRVGLIQAMPAGDAEKDVTGRHWTQRTELMRDAIIYNRNNPSILFYEGGNKGISREHMAELKALRDRYDPHGGRAIGAREMLDVDEAEYGGEMLYINKSGGKPLWAMEYCRDEGYRMYWDDDSYPWHKQGAGPLYRKADASAYNQNQDQLAIEQIRRWNDYWRVRPGMGRRVSAGGVKIVFSDTNTHGRSEMNYRTSGVVDAMRIPKDAFYAHQVMWGSWCDLQHSATHIMGHWNYDEGVRKDVYVVSTSPIVDLYVNGKRVGRSTQQQYSFLHTFKNVAWKRGEVKAIGYAADGTTQESTATHRTAGEPHHLNITLMQNPDGGMRADGSDVALVEIEVADKDNQRCPLDNRFIHWTLEGEGEWRGGIGKSPDGDNYNLATTLPVEAGVARVIVRATTHAGDIRLTAEAHGLPTATLQWRTTPPPSWADGTPQGLRQEEPAPVFTRGETPTTPSYTEKKCSATVLAAMAGANNDMAKDSYDDNERTEWRNDGKLATAWITYELAEPTAVDEINLKLTGWRQRSYPIEVYADSQRVWKGNTDKSLGYVSLFIKNPIRAKRYTIRQTGEATDKEAFGQVTELAGGPTTETDLHNTPGGQEAKGELRIVEIDFLTQIK